MHENHKKEMLMDYYTKRYLELDDMIEILEIQIKRCKSEQEFCTCEYKELKDNVQSPTEI